MNDSGTKFEFHELYEAFHQKIHRYLSRFVDEQEAADLTQEVFIKVNRALNRFRGESNVSTWIYRIATNVVLDRMRQPSFKNLKKQRSISESELELEEIKPWSKEAETQIDEQFIKEEMNQCIRNFIDKLPDSYKGVLVLSEYEGLRNKEIAEVLQVTIEMVKIRLHRAKAKLRKELEQSCHFYRDDRNELACDQKKIS